MFSNNISKKPSILTVSLLASYATITAILFSPAIPMMQSSFSVSSSEIELTITLFLVSYTIGQLFYGAFANRFGRKPTIYTGISIGIIGCLLCAISGTTGNFDLLLIGRGVTAIGAGTGLALAFTIINDYYKPEKSVIYIALMGVILASVPGISSFVGGVIVTYIGWEACFWFLALLGSLILYLSMKLPETKKNIDKNALNPKVLFNSYKSCFTDKLLLKSSIIVGITTAITYLFPAVYPLIVIHMLGLKPEMYGLLFLILSAGRVIGGLLIIKIKNISQMNFIKFGIVLFVGSIIVLALFIFVADINLYTLFIPAFMLYLGLGVIYPNAAVLAVSKSKDKATASTVMSFINVGAGFLATMILGLFAANIIFTFPVVLIVLTVIMVIIFISMRKHNTAIVN